MQINRIFASFFGSLILASTTAAADEDGIQLGNTLTLGYWSGSKNLDDSGGRPVATLQNKISFERDNIKLLADLLTSKRETTGHARIRPRELYAQVNDGDMQVRIGRQIINWGQADFINPTQRFAVVDYRLLSSQQGLEQSGVDGVRLRKSLEDLNFDLVLTTFESGSQIALGPIESLGFAISNDSSKQRLIGLRVSNSDPVHEIAVSLSSGNSVLPVYRLATPSLVKLIHPRVSTVGLDYVYNAGNYAFKVETAYSKNLGNDSSLGPVPLDQLHTVIGFERKLDDYTVAAAFSHKHVYKFKDAYLGDPLTFFNLTAADQLSPSPKDFLLRVTKSAPDLDSGYTAVLRKSLTDRAIALYFAYQQKLTGSTTFSLGANLFQGSNSTYLGSFKKNDIAWTELRFSF